MLRYCTFEAEANEAGKKQTDGDGCMPSVQKPK